MMRVLRDALTIAAKDLRLEFRTKTASVSALVFAAIVLVVFYFARDPTALRSQDLAPSVLWVTFTFAAMLGLNRAFVTEITNRAIDGILLSPVSRSSLYLGKVLANLAFVFLVQTVTLLLFALFFDVNIIRPIVGLIIVMSLTAVAFVAVGTLFSAMAVRTRFAELMLQVLLLPFLVPPIMSAVQMTQHLFVGRALSDTLAWLRLLAAYDVAFLALGFLLFEATLDQ